MLASYDVGEAIVTKRPCPTSVQAGSSAYVCALRMCEHPHVS